MKRIKTDSNLDIAIKLSIAATLISLCVLGGVSKLQAQTPFITCNTPCTDENAIYTVNNTICDNTQSVHIDNYFYCNTGEIVSFKWIIIGEHTTDTLGINNPDFVMSLPEGSYRICRMLYKDGIYSSTSSEVDIEVISCTNVPCVYIDTMNLVIYDTITTEIFDTITESIDEYCIEEISLLAEDIKVCEVNLSPNPSPSDCIQLELFYYVPNVETTMMIINSKGKAYYHGEVRGEFCNLESGIYFLVLDVTWQSKDYRYSRKFIIL